MHWSSWRMGRWRNWFVLQFLLNIIHNSCENDGGSRQFYNIFDKRSIDEVTAAMKLLAIVMYVVQVTKEPIIEFVVVTKRLMNGIYAL